MNNDIMNQEADSPMQKAQALIQLEAIKKQIDEKISKYRADLLETTRNLNVLSLKTEEYVISRVKKTYTSVSDFETLKASLEKENIPYDTVETFADHMKETFKQIAESGKKLEGLETKDSEYIMIRLAKEKHEERI